MKFKKTIAGLALGTYLVSSTGCGMLLHPERQGQTGGRIDPAVAILDGIGLLFFLVLWFGGICRRFSYGHYLFT